jgi:hypothetical protein
MQRLPRLICSQNPFYLLSVCFVLHATAPWFHGNGDAFSPWPLLGLIAGYITMLATTGFVIVRFGRVWDDARSILLLILLLFVELSLIFDETLVRDPSTGRLLQLAGLGFSIGLSELLLCGLKIRLRWLYRVPYHLLLSLLFLYPLFLVSDRPRLAMDTLQWRIFLFPVIAALILLMLVPAIRRGLQYTQDNGTPWRWPWYPWSLFVVLTVCVGFRAYGLTLSFDPVLGASLADALKFESTFGIYFLAPLVLAAGVLLLEVGLVHRRPAAIRLAMQVPVLCLWLSVPAVTASGPYRDFLIQLMTRVGSPLWLALLAAAVFYFHAMLRRVATSQAMLALTLVAATRIGPSTVGLDSLSSPQIWPLAILIVIELATGLFRHESRRVMAACVFAVAALTPALNSVFGDSLAIAMATLLLLLSILVLGGLFCDEFAWLLRIIGAPLIVLATLAGIAVACCLDHPTTFLPTVVVTLAAMAWAYSLLISLRLYQLAAVISATTGTIGILTEVTLMLIRDSGWKGAGSFSIGIGWLMLALLISSWKAGWLSNVGPWLGRMLTFDDPIEVR